MRTLLHTLAAALLLFAPAAVHAQTYTFQDNKTPEEIVQKVVYVVPNDNNNNAQKTIKLQEWAGDNLDGYIRWAIKIGKGEPGTSGLTLEHKNNNNDTKTTDNGYVWNYKSAKGGSSNSTYYRTLYEPNSVTVSVSSDQLSQGVVVICDASSVQPEVQASSTTPKDTIITPRICSIRHEYTLKSATDRFKDLNNKKTAFDNLKLSNYASKNGNISSLVNADNPRNYVLTAGTIHAPNCYDVNYRLPDKVSNYYVSNTEEAKYVRWTYYDEQGKYLGTETVSPKDNVTSDIYSSRLGLNKSSDLTKQDKRYILVEVANSNSKQATWYPAALLTVYLEPYLEHLTQDDLEGPQSKYKNNPYYADRYMDKAVREGKYERITSYTFEQSTSDTILFNQLSVQNNITPNRLHDVESYYAFASPMEFQYRKENTLSIGRGEYALYRTLNYDNVSIPNTSYTITENKTGIYNDWWAAPSKGNESNTYQVCVVDRLAEKTDNTQFGYFLYMDATDEPGVAMKLPIDQLCENTTLIFSAWVCDLKHSGDNAVPAALSFTLKSKRKNTDNTYTETPLTRFYTGAFDRNPKNSTTKKEQAKWQNVTFKFTFKDDHDFNTEDEYILEIANNSKSSNGADYAIDEIAIYRSLPDIDVERKSACDASPLYVSMRHETTLRNLGWETNEILMEMYPEDYWTGNKVTNRKFRYGLMNDLHQIDNTYNTETNLYLAFLPEKTGETEQPPYGWIMIDKKAKEAGNNVAAYTLRVIATSNLNADDFPQNEEDAIRTQQRLNVRAILDYNADIEKVWKKQEPDKGHAAISINDFVNMDGDTPEYDTDNNVTITDHAKYEAAVSLLYSRLQIPPILVPWLEEKADGTHDICLTAIEIENTDLKYKDQPIYTEQTDGSMTITGKETGRYRVMLITGLQYQGEGSMNPNDQCALVSDFTVYPTTTIKVETEANSNVAICQGALRKITATLNAYKEEDMSDVTLGKDSYIFDWFLADRETYNQETSATNNYTVKTSVQSLREYLKTSDSSNELAPITPEMVDAWMTALNTNTEVQEKGAFLKQLLDKDLLKTGTRPDDPFNLIINSKQIVAMPYIKNEPEESGVLYCSQITNVDIPMSTNDIPTLKPGLANISYPFDGEVPLRLGQRHMDNNITLPLPVRNIDMSETADRLGLAATNASVFLKSDGMELDVEVGTVTSLDIRKNATSGEVSIQLAAEAKQHLHEGRSYELLIPFAQYGKNGEDEGEKLLSSECDGLLSLPVKIVPEYLTWKGDANAAWYNDSNWEQSTEAELYMGSKNATQDANGNDDIANAFAPLYFTKITLDPAKGDDTGSLSLETVTKDEHGTLTPTTDTNATENIQYEMAVDTETPDNGEAKYKIVPYYIQKVSEIYFKPGATLTNQHLLDYQKAWVEFEMENGGKRWMASPLQNVYAGDFYAPSSLQGRQETPAFTEIQYKNEENLTYSRWAPAFYQKAWNSAIRYATNTEGTEIQSVNAIANNWSIEYNDVTVEYPVGKGFYLGVSDVPDGDKALVRLPKADTQYTYKSASTKATADEPLTDTARNENAGRLAPFDATTGSLTVQLTNVYQDAADESTARHYLIGNPAMAYLSMQQFFDGNKKDDTDLLARKYWTLREGTFSATVDEGFSDANADTPTGCIPPMEAFFVEVPQGTEVSEIVFTPEMFVHQPGTTAPGTKAASPAASNPMIRLTAERGGTRSVAKLALRDKADNGYKASEDAIALIDSELDVPIVYTVSGSQAAQVNAVKSVKNVGLGVFNKGGGEVTVTIEGLSRVAETLYLYDAQTGQSVKLDDDSYRLTLSGESHGRYFLRDSAPGSELENTISIYSALRGQVIVSALRPVKDIRVFGLDGSQMRRFSVNTTRYSLDLPAGIYLIYASDGEQEHTAKVIVR